MTKMQPAYNHVKAGRDEPILDPDLPIIDSAHHLFDRPALRYLLDDYVEDANAGHRIVASVYVETLAFARTFGAEMLRPLGEIEFANGVAAMSASGVYGDCRVCAAIVGYADLRYGSAIAELLDRATDIAPERFRGIRQLCIEDDCEALFRYVTNPPPRGIMKHPEFRAGFRELASRGLTFDSAVFHHQLGDVGELADAFPNTPIVLNHLGQAMGMEMDAAGRAEVFKRWRDEVRELARRPNVSCKVGGLGLPFWGFGFETRSIAPTYLELAEVWKPYIETVIEAFGVDRCMMESNYPPDGRTCGFVPLWNALKHSVHGASANEKAALFHDTAARVYRIEQP
ncbi:amidohydrolase family protein [Burkholderia pyrrocinia]|uniref:amidohydrolase family protein n=1 Tax=Burkholderia pyrrocinia TaxID=60550 RepID=UPI002AAFE32A|nr:amidohydrolase family protein [Burkholderia pyrrocinia]